MTGTCEGVMQQAEKLLFNGQADKALALFSKEAEN